MSIKAVLSLLTLLAFASKAWTCSCAPLRGGVPAQVRKADLVFLGRLDSITVDTAAQQSRLWFAVQRVFKGSVPGKKKTISLETGMAEEQCGFLPSVGDTVVIFSRRYMREGQRVYSTNLCQQNIIGPTRKQIKSVAAAAKPPEKVKSP